MSAQGVDYVVGNALFGLAAPCSRKDAKYVLDALKAAGYSVVLTQLLRDASAFVENNAGSSFGHDLAADLHIAAEVTS